MRPDTEINADQALGGVPLSPFCYRESKEILIISSQRSRKPAKSAMENVT
jgi:hypothetical protein